MAFTSHPPSSAARRSLWLVAATGTLWAATLASAQPAPPALAKDSPFLPPTAAGAAVAAGENLEFAGVSTMGQKTDLIIHDKAAKKSRWIALGDTVAGITALKYDARLEQAVVRANGVEKVLPMRKGTGPANAPISVPPPLAAPAVAALPPTGQAVTLLPAPTGATTPPVPAQPATPETIAKQEVEARMLVSDLLEIGMAQRKAYEEAQRKGAAGTPAVDPAAAPIEPPVSEPTAPPAP